MNNNFDKNEAFKNLRNSINSYLEINDETWEKLKSFCTFKEVKKDDFLCRCNEIPTSFFFIYKGLVRVYSFDDKGVEYTKIFFDENTFPGSMVSLLTNKPSWIEVQALEDCILIDLNFEAYRKLLIESDDLKLFHIYYLEKNWLINKEAREIALVQQDANERYDEFLKNHPSLEKRLAQYHIASHLGITPTQLSRIRKNRKIKNQHM